MNDPLGLFEEDDKDPLGLFANEDAPIEGAMETGLSMLTGGVAMPIAGIAGLVTGDANNVEKVTKALTYEPRTATGKKYLENTSQAIEDYVRQPMIRGLKPIDMGENEAELVSTIATDSILNLLPLGAVTKAGKSVARGMRENAAKPSGRLDKLPKETAVKPTNDPLSLFEQGELDLFSPDQKQLGVSPYDAIGGKWKVDENGIPFKQDQSLDAARAAEGEQGRLFEDPTINDKVPERSPQQEIELAYQQVEAQKRIEAGVAELQKKFQPPKGQRGAIDIPSITEGFNKLSNGDETPANFLNRWKGTYHPKEWESAIKALDNPSSRDTIAFMSPEQFHDMAHRRNEVEINSPYSAIRRAGVKNALETKNGLDDIPYLKGTINNGVFEIEAHNGRHRMDVFKEKGLDLVPVRLRAGKEDGFRGWGSEDAPRMARGQEGNTMPLPQNLSKKGTGKAQGFGELSLVPKGQRGALNFQGFLDEATNLYTDFVDRYPKVNSFLHLKNVEINGTERRKYFTAGRPYQDERGTWRLPVEYYDELSNSMHEQNAPLGAFKETDALWKDLSKIPKGQRGGIDVKSIGDALKKFTDTFEVKPTKVKETIDSPETSLEKLPGNEGLLDSYIPKDPTPSDVIAAAKAEPDSNIKMNNLKSGATITSMIHKSSLIQGIGRLYQNAGKRSELNIREQVKPVEKTIMRLPRAELAQLGQLLKKEMFDGQVYTSEQLRGADFTPRQIEAYTQMREMFNEVFRVQNEALEALGKKPMSKREAYLSSRWQGGWRSPVYDKDGKLVFYIAETSKRKAQAALDYMAKNADVDISKSKIEFKNRRSQQHGDLTDAYRTMLAVIDRSDPRAEAVRSVYEEGKANEAFQALGQSKHFETKAGVGGFIGDRPWKNPKTDTVEMFQQQFEYAKNGFTWAELSKATDSAKQILSDEELIKSQPNNMAYAQQYAKNKLGFGEHAGVAAIENSLAETFGHDVQTARDALGGLKSWFILSKLGLSPGYVISNIVQPLYTSPWHANLSSQGFKHNPFTTFTFAGADSFAGLLKHYFKTEVPMSEIGAGALKYAEDNGIVSRDITDENAGLGANLLKQTGDVIGKLSIGTVEHIARMNAFMAFVHHLDQSKKYSNPMDLFQHAEELTNASMVDYRPGERPMIFDQAGLVGSAAANLQTFKFNYYNQLHHFFNEAKEGRPRGLMAFVATSGMVGGALSLPFLSEFDDAWEWLKQQAPDDVYLKIKDFNLRNEIIKNLPDLVSFGGMSKITGADMTSRFAPGKLVDWSMDGMFPFLSDFYKQGTAVAKAAVNPTATTIGKAAYAVAPPGPVQGAVETQMDIFKKGTTPTGKTIYSNPNKLELHDADYARTPEQETYRQFGLRELQESKYRTLRNRQNLNDKQDDERMKEQSTKFMDAVVRQDKEDIQKFANRYIAFGGDAARLNTIIEEESLKMKIPKETLDAARASTLRAVQKAKRMKELLNGFNN